MSSSFIGPLLLGCFVFVVLAAVGGVLRRRAGLRDAQALASGDFVIRFSTFGAFMDVLPKLPQSMQTKLPTGTSRVGALSANAGGIVLWQVKTRIRLAELDWPAVTGIHPGVTTYPLGLSSRTYPTLFLDLDGESVRLSLPLLSANAHYLWPRTSSDEVQQIADKLAELRSEAASRAERRE